MLQIKGLKKKFNNNQVLDGIDLTINKGDIIGIIGQLIILVYMIKTSYKETMLNTIDVEQIKNKIYLTSANKSIDEVVQNVKNIDFEFHLN